MAQHQQLDFPATCCSFYDWCTLRLVPLIAFAVTRGKQWWRKTLCEIFNDEFAVVESHSQHNHGWAFARLYSRYFSYPVYLHYFRNHISVAYSALNLNHAPSIWYYNYFKTFEFTDWLKKILSQRKLTKILIKPNNQHEKEMYSH